MTALLWLCLLPGAWAAPILSLDFTASEGDMVSANGLQWEWAEIEAGPEGFTETAWATRAGGDYLNDAADTLGLPALDLSEVERPILVLEHWYEIDQSGESDLGWLEVRVDGEFVLLTPIHGYPADQGYAGSSDGFRTDYFDLSGIDQASDIRFQFDSDASVTRAGWVLKHLSIDDGDPAPPIIQGVTELADTQDLTGPYVVHALVSDDLASPDVSLWWAHGTGADGSVEMEHVGAELYRGEIPGANPGTRVTWWIRASDRTNTTTWPAEDKAEFHVFLAAPTGLEAPDARADGRVDGLEVAIQWEIPDSPHELLHTVLLRDDEVTGTAAGTSGSVPLVSDEHLVTVAGIFDTPAGRFQGNSAAPLALRVALPVAAPLTPAHGFQGDTLRIDLQGLNLLLTEGQVAIQLGEGVEVDSLDISDADSAVATVRIAGDAPTLSRDVIVLSGSTSIPVPGGFEVRSGADRPRILEIQPSSIKQGDQVTITITTNAALGEDPVVDLGAGIFVQSVSTQGKKLTAEIASATDAPVGARGITIDDGLRILDGAELRVRDARAPPSTVCGVMPGNHQQWLVLLAAFGLAWRRRRKR